MSTRSAAPFDEGVGLGSIGCGAALRGDALRFVLEHLLGRVKRRASLTPAETRTKQAVWTWFGALTPPDIERVRCSGCRLWNGSCVAWHVAGIGHASWRVCEH
jgi:hypothetical protein